MAAPNTPEQKREVILQRVVVDDRGCWIWQRKIDKGGYGRFSGDSAHRQSYRAFVGVIPDGLELDHLCCVNACVRPDHLEAVTKKENMRRRSVSQTHCKHGHAFDDANTYRSRTHGRRSCRACNRRAVARYSARRLVVTA